MTNIATKLDAEAVKMAKRGEFIADVVADCKDIVYSMLLQLWKEVYTNKEIPMRHWLDKFQLNLKKVVEYDDQFFENIIHKYMRKKHTLTSLHEALILSGDVYHNEKLMVKKDNMLMINYLREVLTHAAREVWYKPFNFYYITHKKEQTKEAKETLDKVVTGSLKLVLRQQVNELVVAQQAIIEKQTARVDHDTKEDESDYSDTMSEVSSTSTSSSDSSTHDVKSISSSSSVKSLVAGEEKHVETHVLSRRPSFTIDPESGALTPVKALSRSPSVTSIASKPILNDEDDSEDLFIPRSTKIITAIEFDDVGKSKQKEVAVESVKEIATTEAKQLPSEGVEIERSDIVKSRPASVQSESLKNLVIPKKPMGMTYYRPNPKLEQRLLRKAAKKHVKP